MESLLNETACKRANKDTISSFHTFRFWLFELLAGAVFTLFVLLWTPSWISNEWKVIYQVLVPVFVILIGFAVLYLISLIKAPYLQRDEARALLIRRPKPTPLQDKDKLIRTIHEAEIAALELIKYKRHLAELYEQNPDDIDKYKRIAETTHEAEKKYIEALESVDCEKLVAGEDYETTIDSFVTVMNIGVSFWNAETSSGQDFLSAYKNILQKTVKETRNKIEETNQQALENKGFYTSA